MSPLSISAWIQSNWRVLQEALPDWPVASGTGTGAPGWAGPETPSFGHPKDSNGQTFTGCTLCHQGRHNICLYGSKLNDMNNESWARSRQFFQWDSYEHIHFGTSLFITAASDSEDVLMNAGKCPDQIESVIFSVLNSSKYSAKHNTTAWL